MMSIRAKLLILILCLSFLPLLVVGYINFSNFKDVLNLDALDKLETFADYKQEQVTLYLSKLRTRVIDFSSDGFIRDSLQQLNLSGEIEPVSSAAKAHLIDNKLSLDSDILAIDLLDLNGTVLVSTDESRRGRVPPEFLKATLYQNGVYMTDVSRPDDGPMYMEAFSFVASRTDSQEIIGAISIKFNASSLSGVMDSEWLPSAAQHTPEEHASSPDATYLVNSDALIIGHSRYPGEAKYPAAATVEPVQRCLVHEENMNGLWINHRGLEVVGSSRCISSGTFRWVLVTEMDVSRAFLLVDEYKRFYVYLILIVLVLIAVVAIFVTRVVSVPINALNKGVKRIAEGDLDHAVATNAKGEIGELSRAFDSLVAAFRESQNETERVNLNLVNSNQELVFLRDAMDHHAIIVETDVGGVITRVNRRFTEVSLYSERELIGKTHRIVNSGYHPPEFFIELWREISTGRIWHGDIRNRRKDGTIYWVNTTIVPHFNHQGKLDRYVSLRTDITHQKLVEEKLIRSNRALKASTRLQMATLNVGDEIKLLESACHVLVEEGGYHFAWIGYKQCDNSKTILPMAQAGDNGSYLESVKLTWGGDEISLGPSGQAICQEREIIVHDLGTVQCNAPWYAQAEKRGYRSVIALPLREEDQVFGALAIYSLEQDAFDPEEVELLKLLAQDIAYGVMGLRARVERIQAKRALQGSELNLKRAQEIAHLGSCEWDFVLDKHIWSDEQYRILGYRPGEVAPSMNAMLNTVVAEDRKRVADQIESSVIDGKSRNLEFAIARPDGELRHIKAQFIVVSGQDGKPARIVGALLDTTDQMRSESERNSLHNQLQHAQKLHSIGQLTGGIAHDFNNILSSIMGYTTLAIEECPVTEKEYLGYLEEVAKAGTRAQKLIAQLMTFSRRDTREVEHVSPVLLVEDASKMLKTAIPAAIEFKVEIEDDLADIQANQVQMHQIITNLVINARDAIDGFGKVSLSARHRNMISCLCTSCQQYFSGEYVEVSISDTGQGIDPDNLVRMFEPFFTTKEVGKGTGMGLSMVHGLVHSHEGHVRVQSQLGEGSRFSIYLPIYHAEFERDVESPEAELVTAPESNGSGSILVVDDEQAITSMICSLLNKRGYECREENDSVKALQDFRSNPRGLDLLITDQMMPQMNGLELAGEMLAVRRDLPVIMCSGYSGAVTEREVEQAGIKEFVDKPIDVNKLVQLIDGLLHKACA